MFAETFSKVTKGLPDVRFDINSVPRNLLAEFVPGSVAKDMAVIWSFGNGNRRSYTKGWYESPR